jgi:hypothetical protein
MISEARPDRSKSDIVPNDVVGGMEGIDFRLWAVRVYMVQ